jgi:hypothetical protein
MTNAQFFVLLRGANYLSQPQNTIKNSVPVLSGNGTRAGAVVVKIGNSEDLNAWASDFVNQLVG